MWMLREARFGHPRPHTSHFMWFIKLNNHTLYFLWFIKLNKHTSHFMWFIKLNTHQELHYTCAYNFSATATHHTRTYDLSAKATLYTCAYDLSVGVQGQIFCCSECRWNRLLPPLRPAASSGGQTTSPGRENKIWNQSIALRCTMLTENRQKTCKNLNYFICKTKVCQPNRLLSFRQQKFVRFPLDLNSKKIAISLQYSKLNSSSPLTRMIQDD